MEPATGTGQGGVALASATSGQWTLTILSTDRANVLYGPAAIVWASHDDITDSHIAHQLPRGWQPAGDAWNEPFTRVLSVRRVNTD